MNVHMNAAFKANPTNEGDGELSLEFLKRYIAYCRRFFFFKFKII
jgi:hypothetical protein